MNNLQIFNNPEFGQVRTITEGNNILFCASDVAKSLGHTNPTKAVNKFCTHTVKRRIWVETGMKKDGTPAMQNIQMNFIPESDIYRLVVRSRLPTAEKLREWIFDEVIPSIKKMIKETSTNSDVIKISKQINYK